jgi:SAM-dependent methyltransferase
MTVPGFEKEKLCVAYNRHARERDRSEKESWKMEERNRFLRLLKRERVQQLLEIGAGTGQDSLFFQENGLRVTCIDLSPEMVEICREKGLDAHEMDVYQLRFPDGRFDAVWTINCLLHVPKRDLDGVLAEIRRVLKPGGFFYWGVYGGWEHEGVWEEDSYRPKRFFSFFEDEAIRKKARTFFEVIDFRPVECGRGSLHFQALTLRKENRI